MTEIASGKLPDLMANAFEIAASYVSHNHVAPKDLPDLITTLYTSLVKLGSQSQLLADVSEPTEKPTSALIRKSITPDALISFIDGKPYKTLKRHLTSRGFTPASYRERFGLVPDYPMVAPSYSSRRSALASEHGLGIRVGQGAKHRVK